MFSLKPRRVLGRFSRLTCFINLAVVAVLMLSIVIGAACDRGSGSSRVFTDGLGRTVTVEKVPERIVSLDPSNTEVLFALGLGDKLVGNTNWCDYPQEALSVVKVGEFDNIDVEKVVALAPDIIFAEDIHKSKTIPALEGFGFTVFAVVPHSIDEIIDSITTLGKITGTDSKAKEIVTRMKARVKYVTDKIPNLSEKPRVLHVLWADPIMTYGNNTPMYDVISRVGGVSIAPQKNGFPTLTLEEVIHLNPQIVICDVGTYEGGDYSLVMVQTDPNLRSIYARSNGLIYGIDDSLTQRFTERIIDALEWVAAIMYPELFPEFVEKYM